MDIEGILAIVGIFFLPIIMVTCILYFRSREQRLKHKLQAELYAKALELGREVPAELFTQPKRTKNPLNTGIILISVGLGVTLFIGFAKMSDSGLSEAFGRGAALGVIPFLVGVAYLLIYFIGKKQANDGQR